VGKNPIREGTLTYVAPLKQRVNYKTVTFRLDNKFILQKNASKIKYLNADFGDGIVRHLVVNNVFYDKNIKITYSTSGQKKIFFKGMLDDGTLINMTSDLDIFMEGGSPIEGDPLAEDFTGEDGITPTSPGNTAYTGYNETTPTSGEIEYTTYYNTVTNNEFSPLNIAKPIIILDGFDPGDKRKIRPGSEGYDPDEESIYELMAYDDDNNPNNMPANHVEKLRAAPYGFDVTLVNFPNGTDYIERNAMALVSLLKRETQKLAANNSTEEIIIVGPSMGGLIARYALAYMEKNGMQHHTKLWVSFDSPHLGANIPLAALENLYFFGYNGNQVEARDKFNENFRSPAARQMLIEQLDALHQNAPYTTLWNNGLDGQNNDTPFRQQFNSNLTANGLTGSVGFPQNLRKVAVINGTTKGTKTNTEGQMFLELAAFKIIKYGQIFGTSIRTKIKGATIKDRFLAPYSLKSFEGSLASPGGGLVGISTVSGSATRTNTNHRGVMDVVPGGTFNTQGIIKKEFNLKLEDNDDIDLIEWRTYVPNHAFIPTVSALAFKNPDFDWSDALDRNLVCDPDNKEIYFDSYFAPEENEEHVFLTKEKVDWLLKEFNDEPQLPHIPMDATDLAGPDFVCIDDVVTYSFGDDCRTPGIVTQWLYPTSKFQFISSTDYSITLKGINNGAAKITAQFANDQKVEKNVWVGLPTLTSTMDALITPEQAEDHIFCEIDTPFAVSFTARGYTSLELQNQSQNFNYLIAGSNVYIYPYQTGTISFSLQAENECGTTNPLMFMFSIIDCGSSSELYYRAYPNPAIDNINIELRNANVAPVSGSSVSATLYDFTGNPVRSNIPVSNNEAVIDVAALPKGYYILTIKVDDAPESHLVYVEK